MSPTTLADLSHRILDARRAIAPTRGLLVAISGIDASGKSHVTAELCQLLQSASVRVAPIGIDGWLNLPPIRFGNDQPARHFYLNALRFDEMFTKLIFPLRDSRQIHLEADYTEETATAYRKHVYEFHDVDVILLEGIYLLKRSFQAYYDLSVWVECSFETAVERAIQRSQEGLSAEATTQAYHELYIPAQQIHFEYDDPKRAASLLLYNDPRLER